MKYILITAIVLLGTNSYSQDDVNKYTQNFTAQSPEAFAFSKISNIPMNYFTGKTEIKLPLFKKKMSSLNFDLSLIYTGGGGLKKDEPPTILGKSWLLSMGGIITRHKRGVPDDYVDPETYGPNGAAPNSNFNGVLYNGGIDYQPDTEETVIPYGEALPVWYMWGISDSQHDIFEFSLFGKSGKFYIGKSKEILIVTDSKIKIEPDYTTSPYPNFKLGSFLLTDEDGTKYYFNKTGTGRQPGMERGGPCRL